MGWRMGWNGTLVANNDRGSIVEVMKGMILSVLLPMSMPMSMLSMVDESDVDDVNDDGTSGFDCSCSLVAGRTWTGWKVKEYVSLVADSAISRGRRILLFATMLMVVDF